MVNIPENIGDTIAKAVLEHRDIINKLRKEPDPNLLWEVKNWIDDLAAIYEDGKINKPKGIFVIVKKPEESEALWEAKINAWRGATSTMTGAPLEINLINAKPEEIVGFVNNRKSWFEAGPAMIFVDKKNIYKIEETFLEYNNEYNIRIGDVLVSPYLLEAINYSGYSRSSEYKEGKTAEEALENYFALGEDAIASMAQALVKTCRCELDRKNITKPEKPDTPKPVPAQGGRRGQ